MGRSENTVYQSNKVLAEEGAPAPWRSLVVSVLFRPGLTLAATAIELSSLIKVEMVESQNNRDQHLPISSKMGIMPIIVTAGKARVIALGTRPSGSYGVG